MAVLFPSIIQVAASSPLSQLVNRNPFSWGGSAFSISFRSAGPILAAQPLLCDSSVSRMVKPPHWGQVYTFDYFSFSPISRTLSFNSLSFSILPSSLWQVRFTPDSVNP